MSSISSVAASLSGGGTSSASSANSADWLLPSSSGSSTSWLDGSSSQTGSSAQELSISLGNSLAGALTSQINGANYLAGEAALSRIEAAIEHKQSQQAGATGASAPSGTSGYAVVQNLMASLDNITINNGSAPPAAIGSASAANGYSATQNLLTSLDNITIDNGHSGLAPGANAPNALMGVDSIIAVPKVNVTA